MQWAVIRPGEQDPQTQSTYHPPVKAEPFSATPALLRVVVELHLEHAQDATHSLQTIFTVLAM